MKKFAYITKSTYVDLKQIFTQLFSAQKLGNHFVDSFR
jgi:hypothetical protein